MSDSEAILAASAAIRTPRAWGAVALVAVCATILPLGGCRKNNNICKLEPVRSTPGSLILVPSVNDESAAPELRSCIRLTIVDEHGQTVTAMETGVPAKTRWQIGIHADQRAYITSDARGVQCWEKQDDGRWQATRGCYKKVGPDRVRHGRWIWYHDDGTVDRVAWFYLGREVTEDEYVDLLIQEQKSRQGHVAQP